MLNRVSAVLRAYDPCLSCSTHAENPYAVTIELVDTDGSVLDFDRQLSGRHPSARRSASN